MITVFCALYPEAAPLVEELGLKKSPSPLKFDLFQNEAKTLRLVLTGPGAVAAATAVGSFYALFPPKSGDFLLNFGTCGGPEEEGTLTVANKLVSSATGRTFYPDLLFRHPFREGTLVTCPLPAETLPDGWRADMEGAALYEAGSRFLGPHQMIFLKLTSDHGARGKVSPEKISCLVKAKKEIIGKFIRSLPEEREDPCPEEELFLSLKEALHCSATMEAALRQDLRYAALTGADVAGFLREMEEEGRMPCPGKTQGKKILEALHDRLAQ